MHTQEAVFAARGAVAGQPVELTAFAQERDEAWLPAELYVGAFGGSGSAFRGRLHGLGEDRFLTFSALVERRGGRNQYGDLLRVKASEASTLQGHLVPPNAAAAAKQQMLLAGKLVGHQDRAASAARREAHRILGAYGVPVELSITLDAHQSAGVTQRSAPNSSPGV